MLALTSKQGDDLTPTMPKSFEMTPAEVGTSDHVTLSGTKSGKCGWLLWFRHDPSAGDVIEGEVQVLRPSAKDWISAGPFHLESRPLNPLNPDSAPTIGLSETAIPFEQFIQFRVVITKVSGAWSMLAEAGG